MILHCKTILVELKFRTLVEALILSKLAGWLKHRRECVWGCVLSALGLIVQAVRIERGRVVFSDLEIEARASLG